MAVSQEDYVTYIIYNYSNDSVYDGVVLVNTTNYANKLNYSQTPAPGDPVLTIKTSSNNEDSVVVGVQTNFDQDKFYIPVSATFDSFDEFRALYSSKTAKAVLSGDYDANDPRITSILWNRLEDNGPGILTEYTDKADYYIFHRYFEDSKTQFYILYSVKDRTLGCYEFIPTQLVTQSRIGTYFDTFDDFKSFYSAENMEKVLAGEYDVGDPRVDIVSWSHFAESEENLVTDYINNPNYYILHRKGEDGKTQFSLTYFPATHTIVRLEFV
jgi:hypothetical protein